MKLKLHYVGASTYAFHCPACEDDHQVSVDLNRDPHWMWNGSMDYPTFYPSVLVRAGQPGSCHFYITNGKIEFCSDSHHAFAGTTVEMAELEVA